MKTLSKIALGTLLALGAVASASATPTSYTYYLSPQGDDSNSGAHKRAAWQTWPKALAALSPGDTLIVMPGTWKDGECTAEDSNCLGLTSLPNIDCSDSTIADGIQGFPITIKTTAGSERKSLLHSNNGRFALNMKQCSYYNIEGLHGKSADYFEDSNGDGKDDGTNYSVFNIAHSDNINFKGLLVQENNRYRNTHLMGITDSHHILVEASEFYDFHRHGISVSSNSEYVTTRQNYLHARMRADIDGGRVSHTPDMGDECITFYATNNSMSQNDIGFNCEGFQSTGKDNKVLAGIVMDGKFGFAAVSNCQDTGPAQLCEGNEDLRAARDNEFKDSVSINNATGAECKSANGCVFTNMTVVNAEHWGYVMRDDIGTSSGEGALAGRFNPTMDISRSIALAEDDHKPAKGAPGFIILELDDSEECNGTNDDSNECEQDKVVDIFTGGTLWTGTDLFSWNYDVAYSNSGDQTQSYGQWFGNNEADPQMNGCYLDLNEQTAPIGVSEPGAEIGANALFLYENGVRTTTPAFNSTTSQFVGCGAVVEGVNDDANACTALAQQHQTFNVQSCGYYSK